MLREVAEGGAHLDRETLAALAAVPRAVSGIIADGIAQRSFRPIHPMAAYFMMLAPLVVYHAGAPIRRELAVEHLMDGEPLQSEAFARLVQDSMRRTLVSERIGTVEPSSARRT
jgi:hypothetical protein